jgi:hypothetical protein
VGKWLANSGPTKIELTIAEDSSFTWQVTAEGQPATQLTGQLIASPDGIALDTTEQGTLAGKVQSQGEDAWLFKIDGAPASDPGMSFTRVK